MATDPLERIRKAAGDLVLLEANGQIDGFESTEAPTSRVISDGWYALMKETGLEPFGQHAAYRIAYENGWYKGWEKRKARAKQ